MSKQARSSLVLAMILLASLATGRADAQVRVPDYGHLAPAIEEPAPTLRTTTDPATRLWQRLLTWSTRRTSDQRWRALYSRPSTAPPTAPVKTAAR